ncbi:uncharacterized protein BX663DRAFT_562087 [Cokeromyces recurvatus]|uniref:uncharacterized protein n=1 Tax=Cokeromyces recurvatus TaxID=90255 RepID=UPI002220A616|nr:uncharacterized protein BX663DRAFT_562087 [Cokeromyces recurvatus]KAI7901605.1 hypothetical protein BX663DRAFT_562087 [Cokeromyces recurvatus]
MNFLNIVIVPIISFLLILNQCKFLTAASAKPTTTAMIENTKTIRVQATLLLDIEELDRIHKSLNAHRFLEKDCKVPSPSDSYSEEQICEQEDLVTNNKYCLLLGFVDTISDTLKPKIIYTHILPYTTGVAEQNYDKKELKKLFKNCENSQDYIKPLEKMTVNELIEVYYDLRDNRSHTISSKVQSAYTYLLNYLVTSIHRLTGYITLKYFSFLFWNSFF